jgi:hypothetical protein
VKEIVEIKFSYKAYNEMTKQALFYIKDLTYEGELKNIAINENGVIFWWSP